MLMKAPFRSIIQIVSSKRKRGKTSLASSLIKALRSRGIRVAAVKHASKKIDLANRDSRRLFESGADIVVAVSPWVMEIVMRETASLDKVLNNIIPWEILAIVVEGFRGITGYHKVVIVEDWDDIEIIDAIRRDVVACYVKSREQRLIEALEKRGIKFFYENQLEELIEYVVEDMISQIAGLIPASLVKRLEYGDNRSLALAALRGNLNPSELTELWNVKLVVNNKTIPLSPYPRKVFLEVIGSLVRTLKGIPSTVNKIEIEISLGGVEAKSAS